MRSRTACPRASLPARSGAPLQVRRSPRRRPAHAGIREAARRRRARSWDDAEDRNGVALVLELQRRMLAKRRDLAQRLAHLVGNQDLATGSRAAETMCRVHRVAKDRILEP